MRYVILLAMMLLCLPVRGEAWQVVGGGEAASSVGDVCSGTLAMSSHFENDDDITVGGGCSVGDTTWTRDSNCAYSNTTPSPDGGYYADCTGTTSASTYKAEVDSTNLPLSTATVCAYVYMVSSQGADALPVVYDAANEYALKMAWQSGTSNYQARGIAGASTISESSNLVEQDTWTRVCFAWDSTPAGGSQKQGVRVGSNAWTIRTGQTFSDPTVTKFALGAMYGSFVRGFVDGVKVYTDFAHEE